MVMFINSVVSPRSYVSSEQSVQTGASTPLPSAGSVACKVTPLADAALPDLNARYPYGTDDHTDVSYLYLHTYYITFIFTSL